MPYHVIFRNDRTFDYVICASKETLAEAAAAREVSGDIVVDESFQVVRDPCWLFPWETSDTVYARRILLSPEPLVLRHDLTSRVNEVQAKPPPT